MGINNSLMANQAKNTLGLFDDIERVIQMPKIVATEKLKVGGYKPETTNRVVSALEWMEIAGVDIEALFVGKDTFDQLIDEFIYTHPTIQQPSDGCNCIVLPRKDGKGTYNIFRTTEPARDVLGTPKYGQLLV